MTTPLAPAPAADEPPPLPPEILAMMASFAASAEPEAEASAEAEAPEAPQDEAFEPMGSDAAALAIAAAGDEPPATEPDEEETLVLPAVLDITAAAPLHAELLRLRGRPLVVEAGEVKRLGAQCLQLLLSAAATFERDGAPLRLGDVSEPFRRDLALMGHSPETLLSRREAA